MKYHIALVVLLVLGVHVYAGPTEARQHVDAALQQVERAESNTDLLERALLIAAREQARMKLWGIEQQQRADAAEATLGYRVERWVRSAVAWIVGFTVGLYALFVILKLVGLVALGPVGAFTSWFTSIALGWLPGAGWLDTVFSNLFWRVIRPRAQERS